MILENGSISHPGLVRPNNEDAVGSRVPEDAQLLLSRGSLFAVADGVGGQMAGGVASQAAVEALIAEYYSPRAPRKVEAALRQAVQAANLRVFNLGHGRQVEWQGMQTTLTALVLAGGQAYVAHAGDSRVYLLRERALTQVTGDHSEVAELLRLRLITADQAREHPRRNVLTRTLGSQPLMRPDYWRIPIQAGDRFLLCTDGLWGEVEDETLRQLVQQPPHQACQALLALACNHGAGDNVSMQVVHVVDPGVAATLPLSGRLARLFSGWRGG